MKPSEVGRRLGIGVRVAGKIAARTAQEHNRNAPPPPGQSPAQSAAPSPAQSSSQPSPGQAAANIVAEVRGAQSDMRQQAQVLAGKASRSAGRGIGGFLRPFGRVGGILVLEVTGFFFGLFALWFTLDMWKAHLSYVHGPDHQRFLMDCALAALFLYLCISSFWRAQRK